MRFAAGSSRAATFPRPPCSSSGPESGASSLHAAGGSGQRGGSSGAAPGGASWCSAPQRKGGGLRGGAATPAHRCPCCPQLWGPTSGEPSVCLPNPEYSPWSSKWCVPPCVRVCRSCTNIFVLVIPRCLPLVKH
ncbi:hypothetical protein MRX96_020390 [Rhipicephalus microplus]